MMFKCKQSRNMQADRRAFPSFLLFKRSVLSVFVVLASAVPVPELYAASTAVKARTDDSAPDDNGRFSYFSAPVVSNSGQVVFKGFLYETEAGLADNSGIYQSFVTSSISPTTGTLRQVAREGSPIQVGGVDYTVGNLGASGSYSLVNGLPSVAPTTGVSLMALQLPITGFANSQVTSILALEVGDNTELIAARGGEVPSGDGEYAGFNVFSIGGLSTAGRVTFFSALDNTLAAPDDNTAIFRYTPGGELVELVRKGTPTGGTVLAHLASITTNAYGDAVFLGTEAPVPGGDTHIFRVSSLGSSPSLLVSQGDQAPTADVDPRYFYQLGEIRINNEGEVGFAATLRDGDGSAVDNPSGLYITNGSSETEIVRQGQSTPDGTATFLHFANDLSGDVPRPAFNDLGQFAFNVRLLETGGEQVDGIFRASEAQIIEVAREGDGYEDGVLSNFSDPALNRHGVLAFTADLVLGIESGPEGDYPITEQVLILSDGRDYVTVAREGQMFGGRELQEISFNPSFTVQPGGLNDHARVGYEARFTDGTHAVHVWQPTLGWRAEAGDGIWDNPDNWFMRTLPGVSSEVGMDLDVSAEIQGPADDTEVDTLSVGGGSGLIHLILGSGVLDTVNGFTVGVNGTVSGGGQLGGVVNNAGLIDVPAGTLLNIDGDLHNVTTVALGSSAQLIVSGILSGSGDITGVDGQTLINGGLSPGNSPGLVSVAGSLTLGSNSTTMLEIAGTTAGTDHDVLEVGGTLTLDGTLDVQLTDAFSPQAGDELILMQAASIQGDFDEVNLPGVDGLSFELEKTDTSLVLSVQAESGESSSSSGGALSGLWLCAMLLVRLSLPNRRKVR